MPRVVRPRAPAPRIEGAFFDLEGALELAATAPRAFAALDRLWQLLRGGARRAGGDAAPGKRPRSPSDDDDAAIDFLGAPVLAFEPRPPLSKELTLKLMQLVKGAGQAEAQHIARITAEFADLRNSAWGPFCKARSDAGAAVPEKSDFEDAAYFEFLSYVQFATISSILPPDRCRALSKRVGAELLQFLRRKQPSLDDHRDDAVTLASLSAQLHALLRALVDLGYAAAATVHCRQDGDSGAEIVCVLEAPATLWSSASPRRGPLRGAPRRGRVRGVPTRASPRRQQALRHLERGQLVNDFEIHLIRGRLAEQDAFRLAGHAAAYDGPMLTHTLRLEPRR